MARPGKTFRAKRRIYKKNAKESVCKGLSQDECDTNNVCKMTNGPKRSYCRRWKNKKLTSQLIRLNKSNSNIVLSKKKKQVSANRKTKRKPHAPKVSKHMRNKNQESVSRVISDIALHRDQFFNEPCLVLNKLKQYFGDKLYRFTKENVIDIDDILPVIKRERFGKYTYGKEKITVGSKIGEGSYGVIFKAKHNEKDIVIKELRPRDFQLSEFLSETIIQNELYCLARDKFGNGARIPKIEFFGKLQESSGKFKYVIGMETLDVDGYDFISDHSLDNNVIPLYSMFVQVAFLEKTLQKHAKFMHRDLHLGNVMGKRTSNGIKWYIIDFGMSYMQIDDNIVSSGGLYTKKDVMFNETHDLRMLIVSVFSRLHSQIRHKYSSEKFNFFSHLIICMQSIQLYYKDTKDTMFWNTYNSIVHIKDDSFEPDNIYRLFSNLKTKDTPQNVANMKREFKNIKPFNLRTKKVVKANSDKVINRKIGNIIQLAIAN